EASIASRVGGGMEEDGAMRGARPEPRTHGRRILRVPDPHGDRACAELLRAPDDRRRLPRAGDSYEFGIERQRLGEAVEVSAGGVIVLKSTGKPGVLHDDRFRRRGPNGAVPDHRHAIPAAHRPGPDPAPRPPVAAE